jgi:hypothetical protein
MRRREVDLPTRGIKKQMPTKSRYRRPPNLDHTRLKMRERSWLRDKRPPTEAASCSGSRAVN